MIYLIFMVLAAGVIVTFSVQNMDDISVSFLTWQFDISVSTLTVVAVFSGIVIAQLLRAMAEKKKKAKGKAEFLRRWHYDRSDR